MVFHKEPQSVDGKTTIYTNVEGNVNDITSVITNVKTSIVSIEADETVYSGIIIEKDGNDVYIMTVHDVAYASEIHVVFDSSFRKKAEVVGVDVATDICVLKLETDFSVDTVNLDGSYTALAGEHIIAVGGRKQENGNLSVSFGVRSDEGSYQVENSSYFLDGFETDMHVDTRQYGGAAFSVSGEIEGMLIQQVKNASDTMSYVVSKYEMKHVYKEIKENGEVQRGILDIGVRPFASLASYEKNENGFDLDITTGLFVTNVPEDSLAYTKLKYGDRIIALDDKNVDTLEDFTDILYKAKSQQEMNITFQRDGEENTITVVLK